jgi:phage I-like protein
MASKHRKPLSVAIAALGAEISVNAPADVRLLPAGEFKSWQPGIPAECSAWICTDEDGLRFVAEVEARQSARVIDYEHATLHAKKTGTKAPAAGWFEKLEWRPGDGLYMIGIEWTAQAAQEIADKQYRFISPLFSYDPKTGRVLQLSVPSLTNNPGLDGLTDLAALAADFFVQPTTEESPVNEELLEQLRWLLNLPVGATAEDIVAHLQKLISQIKSDVPTAAQSASFDIGGHLAALSAQVATPDQSKFVPIATLSALQGEHADLQGKYVALSADIEGSKVDKAIAAAKAAGKITPAIEPWARDLGKSNFAALSAFIAAAPVVVVPGQTQTGGQGAPEEPTAALSAVALAVCSQLGVDPKAYAETAKA